MMKIFSGHGGIEALPTTVAMYTKMKALWE
jgi:hypothetical protein